MLCNLTSADLLTDPSCYLAMPYQLQLFRTDDTDKDVLWEMEHMKKQVNWDSSKITSEVYFLP